MTKKLSKKERAAIEHQKAVDSTVIKTVGVVAFVFAVLGIVCFFLGFRNISAMCAVITVLNTLIQLVVGGQRDFGAELIFVFLGALIARLTKNDIFQCVVLALCIGDAVLQLFSWLAAPLVAYNTKNKAK